MKTFFVIAILLAFASCGKDSGGSKSSSSSSSSAYGSGFTVKNYGQTLVVECLNGTTIQNRIMSIQSYMQRINNSQSYYVTINKMQVDRQRINYVLNQALFVLQQSNTGMYGQVPYGQNPYGQVPYGQNPYGQYPYQQYPNNQYTNVQNQCPTQVLAQG